MYNHVSVRDWLTTLFELSPSHWLVWVDKRMTTADGALDQDSVLYSDISGSDRTSSLSSGLRYCLGATFIIRIKWHCCVHLPCYDCICTKKACVSGKSNPREQLVRLSRIVLLQLFDVFLGLLKTLLDHIGEYLKMGMTIDALSLCYHRPLLKTPVHCDGCGEEFRFQHALDCKKGGLVTQHHNEVQDALGDLVAIMYKDGVREPIVQEADDANGRPALIADLSIQGVWQPQTAALLDVCVIDTDAQSYASCTVDAVLCSAEQEKKRKYSAPVEERRASFTPFVVSVDGVLGHDAQHLMNCLCDQIAMKWEKSHSEAMRVAGAVKKAGAALGAALGGASAGGGGGSSTAAGGGGASAGGGRGSSAAAGGGGTSAGGGRGSSAAAGGGGTSACDLRTLIALASNASALILLTAARADLVTTF
ncbi:hypothetical protein EMCRGX_G014303 [Ephydatia muelleri]